MRISCLGWMSLLLAATAPVAAAHEAAGGAPAYYDVSFKLEQHGQAMGHPRLLLEPGEPAEIRVEREDGDQPGYRLHVTAKPAAAKDGSPMVALSIRLYRWVDGGWRLDSTPDFTVEPGKPATARIGDRRGGKPPELTVSVTAKPLTEAEYEMLRAKMESRGDGSSD